MIEKMSMKDFTEKVKSAHNIVSIASRYLQLKQKGRTYWACCPFHHEKTPSFAINEMQQYYHCFGCGVSGDVISLVSQVESLDFFSSLEFLARLANIEMPRQGLDENFAKTAKKKAKVLEVLQCACDYYCENLYSEEAKSYLEYLHGRGITNELIKEFHLGASTDFDGVIDYLRKKGFSEDDIVEAGVASRSGKGRVYDAMAVRITFAIFNIYGNCIGFTGRTMQTDRETAKYRNTSQTLVFDKGNVVYGVDVLKKHKLSNFIDKLIVVEGNVDVISLVGAGFYNTVACMGTALTRYHAKIFARFTRQVYICFDGDSAGQSATLRGLDILASENLTVRVVSLPDKLDPDDFIKKNGSDGFNKLLDEARPLVDYKLDVLESRHNLADNYSKTDYLSEAIEVLRPLKDTPQLELYVPRVAKSATISFDAVMRAVNSKPKIDEVQKPITDESTSQISESVTALAKAELCIVACIAHGMPFASDFNLQELGIKNNLYTRLLEFVADYKKSGKEWKIGFVFSGGFTQEELSSLDAIINYSFDSEQQILEKYYQDSVKYLTNQRVKLRIEELLKMYKETDSTAEKQTIVEEIATLRKKGQLAT